MFSTDSGKICMCKRREFYSQWANIGVLDFHNGFMGFLVLLDSFDKFEIVANWACFAFICLFYCLCKAMVETLFPRRSFSSSSFRSTVWSDGLFSQFLRLKAETVCSAPQTSCGAPENRMQVFQNHVSVSVASCWLDFVKAINSVSRYLRVLLLWTDTMTNVNFIKDNI